VDSLRDLADSANALLAECGAAPQAADAIGRMVGDGASTLVARAFAAAGCHQPPDALSRFLAIYNARLLKFTRPYPGMPEALEALSSRAALGVLTNKPLGASLAILEGLDLRRFFGPDRVLGGDGPFPRKPDPAGLRHLMGRLGVGTGDTVLIGDSVIDARTARAAGTALSVARYGFGFQGFPVSELSGDDRLADRPIDLVSIL